jgi:hypothetical protein
VILDAIQVSRNLGEVQSDYTGLDGSIRKLVAKKIGEIEVNPF